MLQDRCGSRRKVIRDKAIPPVDEPIRSQECCTDLQQTDCDKSGGCQADQIRAKGAACRPSQPNCRSSPSTTPNMNPLGTMRKRA